MNVLNRSPANGNGHPLFPSRPSSHHPHRRDACQYLLTVALSMPPASNALRSFQSGRFTGTPLIIPNRGDTTVPREDPAVHIADAAANQPVVKTQGSAVAGGSMEDIGKFSHPPDGGGGGENHLKIPADPTTVHRRLSHHVAEEGDAELEPCATLGFVRSLMKDDRFRLIQKYYCAVGERLDQWIFSPEEPPPGLVTLAVSVSSAVKLESKQMEQIAKKMRRLTGFKSLRMENTVDPSLIAGIVISYGVGDAHVIDLSVKGRLAELEAQLDSSDQSASAEGWNFP